MKAVYLLFTAKQTMQYSVYHLISYSSLLFLGVICPPDFYLAITELSLSCSTEVSSSAQTYVEASGRPPDMPCSFQTRISLHHAYWSFFGFSRLDNCYGFTLTFFLSLLVKYTLPYFPQKRRYILETLNVCQYLYFILILYWSFCLVWDPRWGIIFPWVFTTSTWLSFILLSSWSSLTLKTVNQAQFFPQMC